MGVVLGGAILLTSPALRWRILYVPKYGLWCCGLYHYEKSVVLQGLGGDVRRQSLVNGKTLAQIKEQFKEIDESPSLNDFEKTAIGQKGKMHWFARWSDTSWFIEFKGDVAVGLHLIKG